MSLESGRKLGYIASLISIVLPVISTVGVVVIFFSIFVNAATRIGSSTTAPNPFGLSLGLIGFTVALAAIGITGFILFMVAMYRLSNYYDEPSIFKNVLYAFIINLVSGIIILIVYLALIFTSIGRITPTNPSFITTFIVQLIITYIAAFAIAIIFAIINGLLYMRSFNKLGEKSGIDDFKTAGILFIIGGIIPLVTWIAWIFAAIGFNKLKATSSPSTYVPNAYQPTPLNPTQAKRCPNCGAENRADSIFCRNCGNQLQ